MQPYSNYSRNLAMGLAKQDVELIVYAEDIDKTENIENCGEVRRVWKKGSGFFGAVFSELREDRPDVIHVQQEFNMYGGMLVNALFPFFLLFLRSYRAKIVTTIHAVVEKKLINKDFVKFFRGDESNIPPFLLKTFFQYFYYLVVAYSDVVIVHTDLLKKHLIEGYSVDEKRVNVVPVAAWIRFDKKRRSRGDYFFYFGYLVRRKGLKNVVDGFIRFLTESGNEKLKLYLGGGVIEGQEFARDELLEVIAEHGLEDKIKYLGFLENKEVEEYLSNSYACVVPGVITVAASGPLSHVFGYGKCVLASKVGYLAEEIDDGVEGILTDNDSWEEAFSKAAKDNRLVERIEQNVKKKAIGRSNEEVAKMHLGLYTD